LGKKHRVDDEFFDFSESCKRAVIKCYPRFLRLCFWNLISTNYNGHINNIYGAIFVRAHYRQVRVNLIKFISLHTLKP